MRPLFLIPLLGAALPALGQETPASLAPDTPLARPLPWYRPRHLVLQTAGGMGMIAGGAGYGFWRDRAETDVLVGYVPKKYAGSTLSVFTAKFLYTPFTVPLSPQFDLRPLTVGFYVSYTSGIINDGDRGQYTKGYYWFSADTRVGPLLGGRLSYRRPSTAKGRSHRLSAYYELGSNDLYLTSFFSNGNYRALSPVDILTLGIGLKAEF
jgi:hypothetical protein